MSAAGWVWEGLGLDPGVFPSVYGVGDGVRWFGVDGAIFIFHPNTPINLARLTHARRVLVDISKWKWVETRGEDGQYALGRRRDDRPDSVIAEAEGVSRLSLQFPNITGAFIDDTHGVAGHPGYTADTPRLIKDALCRHNPRLEMELVVYSHELEKPWWRDWLGVADAVSLWVWESANLPHIDRYISACREVFPEQRLDMGIYIRDYSVPAPVSLDLLEAELQAIHRHLQEGTLDGFSILGTCLIDQHPQQAELIRAFIRRNGR